MLPYRKPVAEVAWLARADRRFGRWGIFRRSDRKDEQGETEEQSEKGLDSVKQPASRRRWCCCPRCAQYTSVMAQPLPMPPSGFDDLTVEDKIDYVQSLWDRIAASADQVPLHEWQRQLLEERLAAHRAAEANEARPWGEVLDRLEGRLRASSR